MHAFTMCEKQSKNFIRVILNNIMNYSALSAAGTSQTMQTSFTKSEVKFTIHSIAKIYERHCEKE